MTDIEEKLRKKKEEEEAMWGEYIEQRKKQREKEEDELKKLKDRQARRKTQRAEQEKQLIEMKKKQEEQKLREIEEKKQREAEAKRKRLEEAEKKRQAMLEAAQKQAAPVKANFVIAKKDAVIAQTGGPTLDKFASPEAARQEMNKTKEQLAEDKEIALGFRIKPLEIEGLNVDKLRAKAQVLWDLIVQLESDKYDLEERQKRQDYDLKELNERQRQINRNKALKKGLDPEAFTGKYPPKINTASKYERRVDRRTYVDKKGLFQGGWEELYATYIEKQYGERAKEIEEKGPSKLSKWDPTNPRNKESYEPGARTYDETDDLDIMDTFKPFTPSATAEDLAPAPTPRAAPAPPPPATTSEEEEEDEEEYEEEEEEEEEE
ncbi:Troponin T [Halotydeus destructor]|nr:Troponin T [Halotydeus destructor]